MSRYTDRDRGQRLNERRDVRQLNGIEKLFFNTCINQSLASSLNRRDTFFQLQERERQQNLVCRNLVQQDNRLANSLFNVHNPVKRNINLPHYSNVSRQHSQLTRRPIQRPLIPDHCVPPHLLLPQKRKRFHPKDVHNNNKEKKTKNDLLTENDEDREYFLTVNEINMFKEEVCQCITKEFVDVICQMKSRYFYYLSSKGKSKALDLANKKKPSSLNFTFHCTVCDTYISDAAMHKIHSKTSKHYQLNIICNRLRELAKDWWLAKENKGYSVKSTTFKAEREGLKISSKKNLLDDEKFSEDSWLEAVDRTNIDKNTFVLRTFELRMKNIWPQPVSSYFCRICNYSEYASEELLARHCKSARHLDFQRHYDEAFCVNCQLHNGDSEAMAKHVSTQRHKDMNEIINKTKHQATLYWESKQYQATLYWESNQETVTTSPCAPALAPRTPTLVSAPKLAPAPTSTLEPTSAVPLSKPPTSVSAPTSTTLEPTSIVTATSAASPLCSPTCFDEPTISLATSSSLSNNEKTNKFSERHNVGVVIPMIASSSFESVSPTVSSVKIMVPETQDNSTVEDRIMKELESIKILTKDLTAGKSKCDIKSKLTQFLDAMHGDDAETITNKVVESVLVELDDFIVPLTGYMCTICHVTLEDNIEALAHMKDSQHCESKEHHNSKYGTP